MDEQKRILVTGGAGFIGSHLVNKLFDIGHEIHVVDNLSKGKKSNLNKHVKFYDYDLSDIKSFKSFPQGIDIVFHLSAQVSNEASFYDPLLDINSNSVSSLNLLQWSLENKVKKFNFTSTVGVYADNMKDFASEESLKIPNGFYGINKLSTEKFIKIYSSKGLNSSIFRLFNVYGPGQNMSDLMQGMLSIYMSYVWKKDPILVKGSLERIRDFIYIDDVIDALITVGLSGTKYEILNVCSGRKTSVGEAINLILKSFDEDKNYPINVLDGTPGDYDETYGSFKKINDLYGWEPKISLERGIEKMVKWLKEIS